MAPVGIPSIDVHEARRRQSGSPPALVVDVREPGEFSTVRLDDGVALMPLSTFAVRFAELPRDRELLMMCNLGQRSAAATAHLIRNGYTNALNVAGGITEWQRAGLPVRRGPIQPGEGELPD